MVLADVLVALAVLAALIALIVLAALIALIAVAIGAVDIGAEAADVAAADVAEVDSCWITTKILVAIEIRRVPAIEAGASFQDLTYGTNSDTYDDSDEK
ncbi:MAG: hypothetical protein K0Q87_4277 [Neobacillus sp.]|nr:hypothetical protein [Neobacillus sp.]